MVGQVVFIRARRREKCFEAVFDSREVEKLTVTVCWRFTMHGGIHLPAKDPIWPKCSSFMRIEGRSPGMQIALIGLCPKLCKLFGGLLNHETDLRQVHQR